jgi:DNA-binding CsgD family transcriptional regulator/tetratricopeptide (TPR) repeat protein
MSREPPGNPQQRPRVREVSPIAASRGGVDPGGPRTVHVLERAAPLDMLDRLMLEADQGRGRLLFLGGEAGVGKTALLEAFRELQAHKVRTLTGMSDPLSTPRPLGPLMDMAPSLGEDFVALLTGGGPRDLAFTAFLASITGGRQPSLVVFEDVHWADDATFDLLRFLGRRVGSARSLIVATYRDDEVGPSHRLRAVMGDLATSSAVRRVTLEPLSLAAVEELARGSRLDPSRLHRRTRGNPFFVTEILAASGPGIPATIQDAVMARAGRLSPAARSLLEAAAVIGLRAETAVLSAICGDDPDAVEECVSSGILTPELEALSFRHELARASILETLNPTRVSALHGKVLDVLRREPEERVDLAALSHHADAAGDAEAVLAYAPRAARQAAALRAHREAADQYARSLRYGTMLADETRAMYLEAQSYQCYLTDQLAVALTTRQQALDVWRALGDEIKVGENLRWLSRILWYLGRGDEAEAVGRRAIEVLEARPPGPQLAWAYSNESQFRMIASDFDAAIEWGTRAIELARRFDDLEVLIHATNNVGAAMLDSGDEGGRRQLEESLRLAREADLEEHAGRAYANLVADAANWRLDKATEYAAEGIAYCAEHDLDTFLLYQLAFLALIQLCHGEWLEAARTALSVVERPNSAIRPKLTALTVLGRLRARRGDPGVWEALDEALALAELTGEVQRRCPVRAARAEAAWLEGDTERAAAEAEAAIDLAARAKHVAFWGELAYWRWRSGRVQLPPPRTPEPFRLEMLRRGSEAATVWTRMRCPYEAAFALAGGDDPASLMEALVAFERLGAAPAASATARKLRALGIKGLPRGPRATTRAHPASLTSREAEVLRLVAEGLHNAEIASRLYVTPKTVSHHVSAILAKLGVRTRTEAARLALAGLDER